MVGYIGCESPIVGTVLKQVEHGHGSMGEAVNKYCLKQPLCIM